MSKDESRVECARTCEPLHSKSKESGLGLWEELLQQSLGLWERLCLSSSKEESSSWKKPWRGAHLKWRGAVTNVRLRLCNV